MKRVLIVDDKEENLYYLRALLGAHDFEVESAHHGAEALVKARQSPPDLVISDLLMPVMDGYTLLRHWKVDARLQTVPFVVYTATYTEPEDEQLALRLGADAFILKPTEPDDLMDRLLAVLAKASAIIPSPSNALPENEKGMLREYSETLVRKLEQKTLELEESNRLLVRDIARREVAEAALRESEASFRVLTEAIPQIVWIARPDGRNKFFNQRWVQYTGMTLAESQGRGWIKPFHPEDQPAVEANWKNTTDTYSLEARLRRADGTYRWWLVRGVPLRDSTGAILEWFGTCTDIDDLKQAAVRIEQTEAQLRQAQKMEAIGRLAGGVAHDFNNLLSVILSYTSLLIRDLEPGPIRDDVEEVRRAGERATDLTRQLLAFSRQQVLQPKVLDLRAIVLDMEKMLLRLLTAEVELSLRCEKPLDNVHADPSQIEQIVMNLVVNAGDAMPLGGKLTIETANVVIGADEVSMQPNVAPGSYVMLAVTDTGTGMDASTRERIFEPFFTTKEQGKGTGLGLSTVFGIVNQSRGHIFVYSEPGVGTTFKIYLPRTDRAEKFARSILPSSAQLVGNETILLVEDEEQVRAVNRSILVRHGYHVIDARDGGEALRVAEAFPEKIDLLLTDIVMPRMSGREVALRLASTRPETRVLYVSGYTEDSIVHHGVLDPGIAFLQKPLTPNTLLSKVRDVLSAPAANSPSAAGGRTEITKGRWRTAGRRRVLIIDDEPMLRRLFTHALERCYDVSSVGSAREALLRIAAEDPFDLVLCDVSMPGMTGTEFYDEITRVAPNLAPRIAFLSGSDMSPASSAFFEKVTNPRRMKPVLLSELVSFVDDLLLDTEEQRQAL